MPMPYSRFLPYLLTVRGRSAGTRLFRQSIYAHISTLVLIILHNTHFGIGQA